MASFAGDPQLYDVKRLHMFDAYDTNKWKWMSAAVRPGTEVRNLLDVLQTSLVASMLKPAYDPLQPQLDNWVADVRHAWLCKPVDMLGGPSAKPAVSLRYWGHAARYTVFDWRPITRVLTFRDSDWLELHPQVKRKLGYWPDSIRWIQIAWESVGNREPG